MWMTSGRGSSNQNELNIKQSTSLDKIRDDDNDAKRALYEGNSF